MNRKEQIKILKKEVVEESLLRLKQINNKVMNDEEFINGYIDPLITLINAVKKEISYSLTEEGNSLFEGIINNLQQIKKESFRIF